jgi:hypothetical protein
MKNTVSDHNTPVHRQAQRKQAMSTYCANDSQISRHITSRLFLVFIGTVVGSCLLSGCATGDERTRASASGSRTSITLAYMMEPTPYWRDRLEKNAKVAEAILTSPKFAEECAKRTMTETGGKTVEQICHDVQYAGPVVLKIGFFKRRLTRQIANEQNKGVSFNTAKAGVGSPGNIAHELTHVLGYSHASNWEHKSSTTVPYVIGYVVDELAKP